MRVKVVLPVEKRAPLQGEQANPTLIVLDCGNQHGLTVKQERRHVRLRFTWWAVLIGAGCTVSSRAGSPSSDGSAADGGLHSDVGPPSDPAASADSDSASDAALSGDPGTTVRYAVDTLAQPPNGKNLVTPDSGSNPLLQVDNTPGQAGDIFGLFYCGDGSPEDRFYLLVSSDLGASWVYLAASNAEPNPDPQHNTPWASTVTQDTVTHTVHHAFWQTNASSMRTNRLALSHDANGHLSGWTWLVQNLPGPVFNVAGSGAAHAKLQMHEIIDGNGAHVLAVAGIDCPSASEQARLVVARTTAGATALAPTATADWVKLDGGAGYDVLGAYWINTTGTDPDALVNYVNQDILMEQHTADHTWAELPADRSLHFFFGPYYYNDGGNVGQINRWRFTIAGASWVLDTGAKGVVVATGDANNRPMMGSAVATANYVWFGYGSPQSGLRFDRIDTTGTWTANALPSPDPTSGADWYLAFSMSTDESRAWALWAQPYGPTYERSGYFDGATWHKVDETAAWSAGGAQDPVSWLNVGSWRTGAGVMGYTYDTYGAAVHKYHMHTIATPP
jgi:hypothetical protein